MKCVTMFEGYHWPLDFWKMTSYVVIVTFLETEFTRFRPVVPSEHPQAKSGRSPPVIFLRRGLCRRRIRAGNVPCNIDKL